MILQQNFLELTLLNMYPAMFLVGIMIVFPMVMLVIEQLVKF